MVIEPMREEARSRVRAALAEKGWNVADLARAAAVDAGTVGDFLNGTRWPQLATQQKLDRALGWWPGTIDYIARGETPPTSTEETVGAGDHAADVLLNLSPDARAAWDALPPVEREAIEASTRAHILAQIADADSRRRGH